MHNLHNKIRKKQVAVAGVAVFFFAGAARAVDYAQCEAMQRAITRIEGSRKKELKSVAKIYYDKYLKLECGDMPKFKPSVGLDTEKLALFRSCVDRLTEEIAYYPDVVKAMDKAEAPYLKSKQKVLSDYKKAGCY